MVSRRLPATRAWLPRVRTRSTRMKRSGSCLRLPPAANSSHSDAGRRSSGCLRGNTILRKAQGRWSQDPASTRWREQQLEPRESQPDRGQEPRQGGRGPLVRISRVFRMLVLRDGHPSAEFLPGLPGKFPTSAAGSARRNGGFGCSFRRIRATSWVASPSSPGSPSGRRSRQP